VTTVLNEFAITDFTYEVTTSMAQITIPYAFDTVSVEAGDNAKCGPPTYSVTENDIPVTWITVSGNDLQI
jgi:hypothetical protein